MMSGSIRRRLGLAVLMGAMLGSLVPLAAAAAVVWTVTASPLAATTGVPTTYALTVTNGDLLNEIGCVVVDVPDNFSIAGVGISGSDAGDTWLASRIGNRVTVRTTSGDDRLQLLQWVRISVSATALSTGSLAWDANAYVSRNCNGSAWLLAVPPIVVVTGAAVTPTPQPRPTAVPTAPATPTPTSTPILPLPSLPLPSSGASATASPTTSLGATASPTSSSGAPGQSGGAPTPSTSAAAIPSASSGAGGPASPSSGGSSSPGSGEPASRLPSIRFDEGRLDLAGASVGLFAGIEIWAVPAATIAVPGLLVLIWVALQAAGAIAWIPAVRRLQGEDGSRRRRRLRSPAP